VGPQQRVLPSEVEDVSVEFFGGVQAFFMSKHITNMLFFVVLKQGKRLATFIIKKKRVI
jgi:hypothetical protein